MKSKHIYIGVFVLLALGFSCTDEGTYPIPFETINNSNGGILSQVEVIAVTFDKTDLANAKYHVVLEANDRDRGKLFTKVELFVSFTDRTPGNGTNPKPEKLIRTIEASEFVVDPTSGLPRVTINKTATETMADLGLTIPEVDGTDAFVFRQAMHFPDGRIFTSTNVSQAIGALGGVYKSPFVNVVQVICPSDLGGVISYSSTLTLGGAGSAGSGTPTGCTEPIVGTMTWATTSTPGVYIIEDASFGVWNSDCLDYGNSVGMSLSDACNLLAISGVDQYGDSYTWTIDSNDGTTLVITWGNTWGDGGQAALTRTGGWPLGLTF